MLRASSATAMTMQEPARWTYCRLPLVENAVPEQGARPDEVFVEEVGVHPVTNGSACVSGGMSTNRQEGDALGDADVRPVAIFEQSQINSVKGTGWVRESIDYSRTRRRRCASRKALCQDCNRDRLLKWPSTHRQEAELAKSIVGAHCCLAALMAEKPDADVGLLDHGDLERCTIIDCQCRLKVNDPTVRRTSLAPSPMESVCKNVRRRAEEIDLS